MAGLGDMGVAMLTLQRGRIFMRQGRNDEALAAFDSLVRCPLIIPHQAVLLHYDRGQVLEHLGRADAAAAEYREFLRLWRDADPGQPEVAETKAALARLERGK